MTLDEAITHAREVAQRGGECAKDHEQLAEWLEELRKLKTITATLGYGLNPDGLPAGLTISDDGALLNWRGENYVKQVTLGSEINGETSDGYHTFNELYHHRAVLFSVIVENYRDAAWKAKKHHDGTMYDGMFIVGIETPDGQATYHYDLDPYWDMFDCEEREFAPEWDGHTPDEAIARIATLGRGTCEYAIKDNMNETEGMGDVWIECSACHCVFDYYADEWLMNMHYCPNCGARMERREQ